MWFYLNKGLFPSNVALSSCIMYASEFPWEYHMAWGWWGGGFPDSPLYPSHLIIIFTSWKLFYWFLNLHINTKVDVFSIFSVSHGCILGRGHTDTVSVCRNEKKKEQVKQSLLFLRRDETPSFLVSRGEPPLKRKTAHAVSVSLWCNLVKGKISVKLLFSGTG